MPLFPATIFSHAVSTRLPTGDTMPNPVITTRRLLKTHLYWNGKRNRLRHSVAADCAVAVARQAAAHETVAPCAVAVASMRWACHSETASMVHPILAVISDCHRRLGRLSVQRTLSTSL